MRVVLVALAVLLSGCTLPWREAEDPEARGPPEALSYRFEHDHLGNGRSLPFTMNTSTGTITLRLELRQHPDHPACMPDGTPPRIVIRKPGRDFVTELVAKNAVGDAGAREDGSGDCSAVLEQTVPRVRGVWRVHFMGSGNFTGTAVITGAAAAQ